MGWRDVQAKINSGELDYRRPGKSAFDYFSESFAGSFSDAMRARRAEEAEQTRYERNRRDQLADQERARAREAEQLRKQKQEAAFEQAKQKEKEERERLSKAKKLLQENGRDTNNPNFVQFAVDHVKAYGDDYAAANDAFFELNKRITEIGPMQGPLLSRDDINLDTAFNTTRDAAFNKNNMDDETREAFDGTLKNLNEKDALTRDGFKDEMSSQMDDILGKGKASGVRSALRSGESSGKTDVVDFNKDDGRDHVGLYQIGQARLDDYNRANNTDHTVADLRAMDEEEQEKIADWHFEDIDKYIDSKGLEKYIGQTIGGVTITRSGMIAMAHLGGLGGMRKFLESDGEYNPDDSGSGVKGNSLAQYAEKFSIFEPTTSRSSDGVGEADEESRFSSFMINPASTEFDYAEYAGKSEDELKRLLSVENDTDKKAIIQQMLDATKEAPDYAKMSDDELKSRIAAEDDPVVQAVMKKALDARIEAPDYATMSDDELKSRIATEDDPEVKSAMKQALDARVEEEPFNIADYDDIEDATLTSMIENEKDEEKKLQLQGLLHNRQIIDGRSNAEILPGSDTYSITYKAVDGTLQTGLGFAAKSGEGYVIPGVGLVKPVDTPVNTDQLKDGLDAFAQIQGKLLNPVVTKRQAYAKSIESASKMAQLVQDNEAILTTVGGTGTRILQRVGAEVNALGNLRTLFEEEGYTEDQVLAYIDGTTQSYLSENVGKLSETAQAAALLEAERIKFAFSFAAAQLGQSNTGLSNKDFDNAMKIISQGSTKETFLKNLRSQIGSLEQDVNNAINDLTSSGQFKLMEPILPQGVLSDYALTPQQYLEKQGMLEAYNALMTDAPAAVKVPQDAIDYLNRNKDDPDMIKFFEDKYGVSASTYLTGGE